MSIYYALRTLNTTFFEKNICIEALKYYFCSPKALPRIRKTQWPVRLGVRTGDFHSSNRGSIPLRATDDQSVKTRNEASK
jgi:hypothetical protein